VSLINPSKALSSTGAFGGIFRQLRERAVGRTVSGKTDAATAEKLAMALSHDGKEITLRSFNEQLGGGAPGSPQGPSAAKGRWRKVAVAHKVTNALKSVGKNGLGEADEEEAASGGKKKGGGDSPRPRKSRLSSSPRTQRGRRLQESRRLRQRQMLEQMKAKREERDAAVQVTPAPTPTAATIASSPPCFRRSCTDARCRFANAHFLGL